MAIAEPLFAARADGSHRARCPLSVRTILLVAAVVAIAWSLASIASVLLMIFVSVFSTAVLSPGARIS